MKHETLNAVVKQVPIKDLCRNTGQIEGVPKNPRIIKDGKFAALKKSISEFPGMLDLREIVCYEKNGELIVIGGNMRLAAIKELGIATATVKILAPETPPGVLKRFIITDNTPYGEWDWDALSEDWDSAELADWGLDGGGGQWDEDGDFSDTVKDAPAVKTLKIGEFTVPLSDTEYGELCSRLVSYVGENVIPDGFFASVLDIENDAERGSFFLTECLDKIKGAAYNPRKISDGAMDDLKESIRRLGICRPIIVNMRNSTIIAGHQRVKAMLEIGIKRGPVFYIDTIDYENEIRINQIHNAIEDEDKDINMSVGESGKLGFIMTREIKAVPQNTVKALNYAHIINKYGNIDSAVALQNGTVIKGGDYLLACKMMRIPARVFYIGNDKKDDALRLLFKDYGQFCYDGKQKDSYQQNQAQMNRLSVNADGKRANYSQTYAMALKLGLLKDKRVLDFGAGKCAFAEKLAKKGYDITPIEFFRKSDSGAIDADWANAQIDLISDTVKNKGLYDVVICDSVLNSVISEGAESDVINCCAVFLKKNGQLVISGRIISESKTNGNHRTTYQLDDKGFTMNMRGGEWYAQHFHKKEGVKPLLEKHGLVVEKIEFDINVWRAACAKGEINLGKCLTSIENEFNLKYNKTQAYNKGGIVREALLCAYN